MEPRGSCALFPLSELGLCPKTSTTTPRAQLPIHHVPSWATAQFCSLCCPLVATPSIAADPEQIAFGRELCAPWIAFVRARVRVCVYRGNPRLTRLWFFYQTHRIRSTSMVLSDHKNCHETIYRFVLPRVLSSWKYSPELSCPHSDENCLTELPDLLNI